MTDDSPVNSMTQVKNIILRICSLPWHKIPPTESQSIWPKQILRVCMLNPYCLLQLGRLSNSNTATMRKIEREKEREREREIK